MGSVLGKKIQPFAFVAFSMSNYADRGNNAFSSDTTKYHSEKPDKSARAVYDCYSISDHLITFKIYQLCNS